LWERDLIEDELHNLMHHFDGIAKASYRRGMSIISLICNVQRTSEILERVRARLPVAVPKLQPARGS
jgi:aspartate kinase